MAETKSSDIDHETENAKLRSTLMAIYETCGIYQRLFEGAHGENVRGRADRLVRNIRSEIRRAACFRQSADCFRQSDAKTENSDAGDGVAYALFRVDYESFAILAPDVPDFLGVMEFPVCEPGVAPGAPPNIDIADLNDATLDSVGRAFTEKLIFYAHQRREQLALSRASETTGGVIDQQDV